MPFMRASRLPKVRRLPVSTLSAQVGRIATSNMFLSVSFGGMDRPFFGSRRRSPCTGMSTVSMMAEQLAAERAIEQLGIEAAIAHEIDLEPERFLHRAAHVLDRADGHGGKAERHAESLRGACA